MGARKTSPRKTWCDTHQAARVEKPSEPGKTYCPDCYREQQERYRRAKGRKPAPPRKTPEELAAARQARRQRYEAWRSLHRSYMKAVRRHGVVFVHQHLRDAFVQREDVAA